MIYEKLKEIQSKLKASKGQYKYRSCEDISEALKPLLEESKAAVTMKDEVVQVGERIYIKVAAKFTDIENKQEITTIAYVKEGVSLSYARKYVLYGLFAIDYNKDSDATNNQDSTDKPNTGNARREE